MHIVHVCRIGWPSRGGMETVVQGLSVALRRRGHQARVVTLRRSVADGSALPEGASHGVPYRRLRRVGPRRYPLAVGLGAAVRGADVVHVHGIDGLLDQLVWGRGRPPIGVSTHGGFWHTRRNERWKGIVARSWTRRSFARADAVWFTSAHDRDRFAPSPGAVLPNGAELGPLLAQPRAPEPGLWVVPGRVVPHKGHADLLGLVAGLPPSERPRRLVAVGPCPDRAWADRLDRTAARHGLSWERTGAVGARTWRRWLARAARVVLPSTAEGFGLALLEAMAAGAPVVARDLPSHRDLAGRPLPALTRPADLCAPMSGEEGRDRAVAWDWSRRITDYEQAYAEVAA